MDVLIFGTMIYITGDSKCVRLISFVATETDFDHEICQTVQECD